MQRVILINGWKDWDMEGSDLIMRSMSMWRSRGKRLGCLLLVLFVLSGCGNQTDIFSNNTKAKDSLRQETDSSKKTLIAYFTLADNYEDPSDMDATSQASLNVEDKDFIGNTEYLANAIQEETGGDLFSVVVKNRYPNDYDRIVDMGSEEQEENARPELSSHVDNMEQYDTVFVGFPIWWYTMPQAMFTFLEEYDFSGKTVIPFATHGGYGVGSSVEDIQTLCPDAKVVEDIFEAERGDIPKQMKEISSWVKKLEI